jgi:hypothetical protein
MKAVAVLVLLAVCGPALADTPVKDQGETAKPYVNDGPGLNSFSPPGPVSVGSTTIVPPPAGSVPPAPQKKVAPKQSKTGVG